MNDVTNANSRKIENRLHLCWRLDGLKWTALNNDKPVVTSSMSTKAIRDPAILVGGAETDLRILGLAGHR